MQFKVYRVIYTHSIDLLNKIFLINLQHENISTPNYKLSLSRFKISTPAVQLFNFRAGDNSTLYIHIYPVSRSIPNPIKHLIPSPSIYPRIPRLALLDRLECSISIERVTHQMKPLRMGYVYFM